MGVGGQHHTRAALSPGKTQYPLYRRLGGPQGPVWTGAENLATPLGFDPRTAQPVASRYTDWAIPAAVHPATSCYLGIFQWKLSKFIIEMSQVWTFYLSEDDAVFTLTIKIDKSRQ